METVAVVASIVAIIQISDRVISACKFYIQAADGTPSDLRAILVEVSTLKSVLETLQFLQTCTHAAPALWKQLSENDGPIEECRRLIAELEKLFPSNRIHPAASQSHSKKRKLELVRASLAWPLKARRAKEILNVIIQQKTMINLALTAESSQDIKSIKKDTAAIRSELTDSQNREVYRWLETTDPSPLHNRAWKVHEPHTSGWIQRSPEWSQWLTGDTRCLWIHGIPGAGKTILASFIVEQVKRHCTSRQNSAHSYYYCYFGHNQDEASPFLRWTIAQLCRQANGVSNFVYGLYKQGGQPSLSELMLALEFSLESFDRAYVIIDAVDESKPREDLLRVIRDLATDSRFSKVHCVVTSREYIDIEQSMEPISCSIAMSNALVDEDIRKHVHSALHSGSRFRPWPIDLLTEVEDAVVHGSKGMFRWAICQLDRLQWLKCDRLIIRKELATLPKTLDETYERIFMDIAPVEWIFARDTLRWICFHQDIYEDNHALSMQILLDATELSAHSETHEEAIFEHDAERLRRTLGSLVTVDEYNLVFLAHYTVKEYLESQRLSDSALSYFQIGQKTTTIKLMQIILQESQEIQGPQKVEDIIIEGNTSGTPDMFLKHFGVYCVILSMMLILTMPDTIASDKELLSLVADFLNPTLSHYLYARYVCCSVEDANGFFMEQSEKATGSMRLPIISTESDGIDHVILLHLLLFTKYAHVPVLAEAFWKGRDLTALAQRHVKFTFTLDYVEGPYIEDGLYAFDGSLLEVMAQLSFAYIEAFTLLLYQTTTATDISLLLYTVHSHDGYVEQGIEHPVPCALQTILDRGADPNNTRYSITPLQIAAATRDVEGVRELLGAGADVNAIGNPYGERFKADSVMSWCNELQGLSPLYICRSFREPLDLYNVRQDLETSIPRVEALLLQHGAKEYLSPPGGSSDRMLADTILQTRQKAVVELDSTHEGNSGSDMSRGHKDFWAVI